MECVITFPLKLQGIITCFNLYSKRRGFFILMDLKFDLLSLDLKVSIIMGITLERTRSAFRICLAPRVSSSATSESPSRAKSALLSIPPVAFGAERTRSAFLRCLAARVSRSETSTSSCVCEHTCQKSPVSFTAERTRSAFLRCLAANASSFGHFNFLLRV